MKKEFYDTTGNPPKGNIEGRLNDKDERLVRRDLKPFKLIPNVKTLKIELSDFDDIFLKRDIQKRLEKAKLNVGKSNNGHINKYMKHQLKRMRYVNAITY